MALVLVFLLGIANFTLHKAVRASDHPLVLQIDAVASERATLAFEFVVLLLAMAMAAYGFVAAAVVYGIYTAVNAVMAWALLSGRI